MALSWEQFGSSALTTSGLLGDLLSNPDDPNTILQNYGLDPLASADVDRWKGILQSTSETPTRKELLEYISRLLPGSDAPGGLQTDPPPMW